MDAKDVDLHPLTSEMLAAEFPPTPAPGEQLSLFEIPQDNWTAQGYYGDWPDGTTRLGKIIRRNGVIIAAVANEKIVVQDNTPWHKGGAA